MAKVCMHEQGFILNLVNSFKNIYISLFKNACTQRILQIKMQTYKIIRGLRGIQPFPC